jgi:hypothetical protein
MKIGKIAFGPKHLLVVSAVVTLISFGLCSVETLTSAGGDNWFNRLIAASVLGFSLGAIGMVTAFVWMIFSTRRK